MTTDLSPELSYFILGIVIGMYGIVTVMLGLQLTTDIFKMRRTNLLTRVTGAAMLVDAFNIFIPAFFYVQNGMTISSNWTILIRALDYVTLVLLLCIGDVLLRNRLSSRKIGISIAVIISTLTAYYIWGETGLNVIATPVFFLATYAIAINCRRILKYEYNLPYIYSNVENRHKQWYIWLCIFFMVEIIFWLLTNIAMEHSAVPKLIYYIFMTFFWILLFRYASMQKPNTLADDDADVNSETDDTDIAGVIGTADDYKRDDSKSNLLQRMETMMTEKKLYLNSDLTLITLADELGTNRTYVSHIFNHELNVTFYQYVNNLRIEYARQRITESDEKLSIIAYESGFSSPANMVRVMREYTGMTPSQIRSNRGEQNTTTE